MIATPPDNVALVPVRDTRSSCLNFFALVCRCDDGCPQRVDRARPLKQPCPPGHPSFRCQLTFPALGSFRPEMSHSWMRRPFAFLVLRPSAACLRSRYVPMPHLSLISAGSKFEHKSNSLLAVYVSFPVLLLQVVCVRVDRIALYLMVECASLHQSCGVCSQPGCRFGGFNRGPGRQQGTRWQDC